MVLALPDGRILAGGDAQGSDEEALLGCAELQASNAAFLGSSVRRIPASTRSVHVLQGEQAWVSCADHSYTLGSSDATTCVIVVIVCHGARRAWCAHHDANTVRRGWGGGALADGVRQWGLEGQAADVYLVGAFQEASGVSAAVAHGVLAALRKCPLRLTVRLACILHANTTPAGGPASLHVAVDAASGAAHPATFADRGPELPRRMAYAMMRPDDDELPQVYRADEHRLVLPGFSWRVPARVVDHFRRSLEQSDADFLLYNSTSPEHEPPNFVDDVKAQYRYIIALADVQHVPERAYVWATQDGGGAWVEELVLHLQHVKCPP